MTMCRRSAVCCMCTIAAFATLSALQSPSQADGLASLQTDAPDPYQVETLDMSDRDPAEVDRALTGLRTSLRGQGSRAGLYLERFRGTVVFRGLPEELDAVRTVLAKLALYSPPAQAEPRTEVLSLRDRDAASVTAALAALNERIGGAAGKPGAMLLQIGTDLVVCGSAADIRLVREVCELLPASDPVTTKSFGLRRPSSTAAVQSCLSQARITTHTDQGQTLIARAPSQALAELEARLEDAGLLCVGNDVDRYAAVQRTVRLRYFTDASVFMAVLSPTANPCWPDVVCTYATEASSKRVVVLSGPRNQVDALRRAIAALDVPLPQMRLDLWAIQLTGSNANEVAARAQQAQEQITAARRLVAGYLQVLEDCALEAQQEAIANAAGTSEVGWSAYENAEASYRDAMGQAESAGKIAEADRAFAQQAKPVAFRKVAMGSLGAYRLSLTQTLALSIMCEQDATTSQQHRLRMSLGMWVLQTALRDPQGLQIWAEELAREDDAALVELGQKLKALPDMLAACRMTHRSDLSVSDRRRMVALLNDPEFEAMRKDRALAKRRGWGCRELEEGARLRELVRFTQMALVPQRFVDMVADARPKTVGEADDEAGTAVLTFLITRLKADAWPEGITAEQIAVPTANAQTELQAGERALNEDISRLFLGPLQSDLRRLAGNTSRSGLASVSATSISVLSGVEAKVEATAVSYFEVTQQPKLDAKALTAATDFATGLAGAIPVSTGSSESSWAARVTLKAGADAAGWVTNLPPLITGLKAMKVDGGLLLMGTKAQVEGGLAVLRTAQVVADEQVMPGGSGTVAPAQVLPSTSGAVSALSGLSGVLGSASGIPLDRILSLAMALGPPDPVWSAMREGSLLTFTPTIVPGGGSAHLVVDAKVTHDDPGASAESAEGAARPLSRVALHSAKTTVYLEPLDLFALSSFAMRTTTPRPDFVLPIFGQIPFLGQIFHFQRRPSKVQHESMLLAYSTILPTATDLAELMVTQ